VLGCVLGAFRVVCCRVNRSLAGAFGGFAPREVAGGSPGERALGGVQPPATALSRRHVTTRLTQLRALGPNVRMTPLGDVRLGANDQPRPEKPEQRCEKRYMVTTESAYSRVQFEEPDGIDQAAR
jgi:hypothetical protein